MLPRPGPAALCGGSWALVAQTICGKKSAGDPGLNAGRAECRDQAGIAAEGRVPGRRCAGRAGTECRLWEGRAQQLSQPFVLSLPGARVPYCNAVLRAQRVGSHLRGGTRGHLVRGWTPEPAPSPQGPSASLPRSAVSGRTGRAGQGHPTHMLLLCFGWDAACLFQHPMPARAHADTRGHTEGPPPPPPPIGSL